MKTADQDSPANDSHSLPRALKRRSLWGRKPQQVPETAATKTSGGVTVTPHTGMLPRVSASLPQPAANVFTPQQPELAIPGIPAHDGFEAKTDKNAASVHAAAAAASALKAREAATDRSGAGEHRPFTLTCTPAEDANATQKPETIGIGSAITTARGQHLPQLQARSGEHLITAAGASAQPSTPATDAAPGPHHPDELPLRDLVSVGWLPRQRGIWAILAIPLIIGATLTSFNWRQIVLFCLWITLYFAYNASIIWLRMHRQERYWPPVRVYGLATLLLGALAIVTAPELLEWSIVFVPILALAVYEGLRRHANGLVADSITVLASCIMLPVAYDLGTGFQRSAFLVDWLHRFYSSGTTYTLPVAPTAGAYGWQWIIVVTISMAAYFWSTLLFTRTVSHRFYSVKMLIFSVSAHVFFAVAAIIAYSQSLLTLWNMLVWVLLAARSLLLPLHNRHSNRPLTRIEVERFELLVMILFILSIFSNAPF